MGQYSDSKFIHAGTLIYPVVMSFFCASYDMYVMVADPLLPPPWRTDRWLLIARELDDLVERGEKPAAVRTTQLQGPMGRMKPISFGRIGWNEAGHAKWTLDEEASRSATRLFVAVEAWAPSWTRSVERGQSPDVYVRMLNPASEAAPHVPPILLVAVRLDTPEQLAELGRVSAEHASVAFGAVARARNRRPWGYKSSGGFTGSVQDLMSRDFFDGPGDEKPKGLPAFAAGWEVF